MEVYIHYENNTVLFDNVITIYIKENYLMLIFKDDFKTISFKDCKDYTILSKED